MAESFKTIVEPVVKVNKEAYEKRDGAKVDLFREVKVSEHTKSGTRFISLAKGTIDPDTGEYRHSGGYGISEEDIDFYIEQIQAMRKHLKKE